MTDGGATGESLRALRVAAGVSRSELADALGVRPEILAAIERGASTPSPAFVGTATTLLADRLRRSRGGP